MHIALFIHALTVGGAQSRTLELANGLAAMGHRVDLVVAARGAAGEARLDPRVRLVALSQRAPETVGGGLRRIADLMTSVPALARYLNGATPEIFLSMANHVAPIAAVGHALMRRPKSTVLVLRASNHVTRTPSAHGNALRRLHLQPFWTQADHIIAVSGSVGESLSKGLVIAAGRISVLPSPILPDDVTLRAAQTPEHDWLRTPDAACPTILGIGRFVPQKGFDLLLDAFDALRRQRPARLLLLGDGPQRPLLEDKVRQLGLEDLVSLPGIVRNPFAALGHAALFVLPSRWEGMPATLIEALACGCPVVATDCPGGVREVLQDGRIGQLVPPGDAGRLAAAMADALGRTPDRAALQAAIRPYRTATAIAAYEAWLRACLHGRNLTGRKPADAPAGTGAVSH